MQLVLHRWLSPIWETKYIKQYDFNIKNVTKLQFQAIFKSCFILFKYFDFFIEIIYRAANYFNIQKCLKNGCLTNLEKIIRETSYTFLTC